MRRPWTNFRSLRNLTTFADAEAEDETIWALRDVSFTINSGETVGIIGANGAGKSTLLKVLSRITQPTHGNAVVNGRVSSLLEVGTGFHPDLTGRENVYLNGAILGMPRNEIDRKFDEIVEFSDVGKFIDTPVKRYSSGMGLRLAFPLPPTEPEILMVDEVLAVGDIRFQKKCLSKMGEVASAGRTVLYVAHNMPAISRLCKRAILMDRGRVVQDGPAHEVISTYLNSGLGTSAVKEWPDPERAPGGEIVRLRAVRVTDEEVTWLDRGGGHPKTLSDRDGIRVLKSTTSCCPICILKRRAYSLRRTDPIPSGADENAPRFTSAPGGFPETCRRKDVFVDASMITLEPFIFQYQSRSAVAFLVTDSLEGDSARGDWTGHMPGVVRPMLRWTTQHCAPVAGKATTGVH